MKYRALILFFALLMTSCKVCQPIEVIRDSVRTVEVHTRDTTIITEADSAQVRLLLRCDSANNVLVEEIGTANGERLQLQARLRQLLNGYSELKVDCKEDSLEHIIQLQDSIIKTMTSTTIVQEREMPKRTGWDRFCTWWFIITALLLLGYLGYKGYRLYLKFQTGGLL